MTGSDPQERRLLSAARRGDREALASLLRPAYPLVLAYLVRLGADRARAEDLAQESMIRVILNVRRFRPRRPGSFRAWLLAIATHLYRDEVRRASRLVPLAPAAEEASPGAPAAEAAEAVALGHLESARVVAALRKLAPAKRAVLLMKYMLDFTHPEIGEALGCPEGTVKSRLHQALVEVRAALREGQGDEARKGS